MGLNTTINIKYLAANFIFKYISEGKFLDYSTLQGVDAEIIEVEVKPESSVLGKQLKDLNFYLTRKLSIHHFHHHHHWL